MTETQAREQYDNVKVATMPVNRVARAIETNETRGVMKAVVNGDSDQILGCAILSVEGGEIMSMLEIAMMGNVPYTAIRDGVFAHPTLAESLNNLFATIN
jgi:pyruvate/2-oxoglutarate dehydrogenase complex dihydrolipoamide dehydrogenase (E3) component